MNKTDLKEFLNKKAAQYNSKDFIKSDPIQLPHQFNKKEDIEIIGFLVATIAWGNRTSIINSGKKLIQVMQNQPYHFVINYDENMIDQLNDFKHRTFNVFDLSYFFLALKNIYQNHNGMEAVFAKEANQGMQHAISAFKKTFFELEHEQRTEKHLSDPMKGSAAKRINMFLRWMVRKDNKGVDFGIWDSISPSLLYCPLDVHTGNVARELGLIKRKQNDWKALEELQEHLISFDPKDPCKYDFALFGIGAFERGH